MTDTLAPSDLAPLKRILGISALGPFAALVLACAFFAIKSDTFFTGTNLSLIVQQTVEVGTIAIGQTLIILTAGIDLSCGAAMSLAMVVMTRLAVKDGVPPLLAMAIGVGIGTLVGVLNGSLVAWIRLPAFIVTLGTLGIAFSLTHIYSEDETMLDLPSSMTWLGNTFKVAGTEITYGSVAMVLLYAVVWFFLGQTATGRRIFALGDNPEAVRLAGVRTRRLLLGIYASAGFIYGLAAVLLVARTGAGDPNAGQNDNLDSITAVVLGGTSLFGGRGTIIGTLIGALVVTVVRNGLIQIDTDSIYQVLITGILVILAVALDQLTRRRRA